MVTAEVALARFANATSKTEMTMDEAASLSRALARDVRNYLRDHDLGVPSCVIGIATGGLMVAKIVADDLNVPLEPIFIRRRGSRLKRALGKVPFVVNLAAAVLRIEPIRKRLVPLLNRMNQLESKSVEDSPKGLPLEERKPGPVVLIDDCVESGNTILQATDQLRSAHREILVTGVLAVSATALTDQQREQLGPLVSLLPRLHRFPWSQDNPAYAEFLNWLQTHRTLGW